ncbi:MAG: hypothetical protein FJ368_03230 [Pelagibacterales bacterium]|nr:hypothetical protein [Pelagibacterales bacterium]
MKLNLSNLAKTWLFDVDGTIVEHNGHLRGEDCLLKGVKEFFANISADDKIIILTAREKKHESALMEFLTKNGIRYDHIISDLPFGERILINDEKPSGMKTAYAVNIKRNQGLDFEFKIDESL